MQKKRPQISLQSFDSNKNNNVYFLSKFKYVELPSVLVVE